MLAHAHAALAAGRARLKYPGAYGAGACVACDPVYPRSQACQRAEEQVGCVRLYERLGGAAGVPEPTECENHLPHRVPAGLVDNPNRQIIAHSCLSSS